MNDDYVESVEPLCDRPHPRELAHNAVLLYRQTKALRDEICGPKPSSYLTQADIDGTGNRSTVEYTRRAVRGHHASLLRRLLNFLVH